MPFIIRRTLTNITPHVNDYWRGRPETPSPNKGCWTREAHEAKQFDSVGDCEQEKKNEMKLLLESYPLFVEIIL